MFIAAASGVSDDAQGIAAAIVSTAAGVGASVGLAILVVLANSHTVHDVVEHAQVADVAGIRRAVFSIGSGIIATVLLPIVGLQGRASAESS
jgi:hypothetical protein